MKMPNPSSLFPKKIGEFSFQKILGGMAEKSAYSFAVYTHGKKIAICKLWNSTTGTKQNKQWLINEIHAYLTLESVISIADISEHEVNIPTLYEYYKDEDVIYVLIEKVNGTFAGNVSAKEAVTVYKKALRFFDTLNEKLTDNYFSLATRSGFTIVAFFAAYTLMATIKHPKLFSTIMAAKLGFFAQTLKVITNKKIGFVHRDLGGYNNVLVNKKVINIIDFQISVLTHPLVEVANIFATKWSDKKFIAAFTKDEYFKKLVASDQKNILKAFLLYAAMFDLASGTGCSTTESVEQINFAKSL